MQKLTSIKAIVPCAIVALSTFGTVLAPQAAQAQSRAYLAPSAMDTGTGTGTAPAPTDYTDTFANVTTQVQSAITGPGKLAIGVMILGVVFSVVWRLVKKGAKSIG